MYVFQSAGQLSIEEFYVPFGGQHDPGNRWVVLAGVIPWEPFENQYARLCNSKTGVPCQAAPDGPWCAVHPARRDLSGKLSVRGAVLSTEFNRTAGCASRAPWP